MYQEGPRSVSNMSTSTSSYAYVGFVFFDLIVFGIHDLLRCFQNYSCIL